MESLGLFFVELELRKIYDSYAQKPTLITDFCQYKVIWEKEEIVMTDF